MNDWRIPGFTSTASKRPEALFGEGGEGGDSALPRRLVRAQGARVWDADGREYVDYIMALGAVALGYGHAAVNRAAEQANTAGVVGPLSSAPGGSVKVATVCRPVEPPSSAVRWNPPVALRDGSVTLAAWLTAEFTSALKAL